MRALRQPQRCEGEGAEVFEGADAEEIHIAVLDEEALERLLVLHDRERVLANRQAPLATCGDRVEVKSELFEGRKLLGS